MPKSTAVRKKLNLSEKNANQNSRAASIGFGIFRFLLFSLAFILFASAVIQISRVFLRTDIVPDVSGPVSRFVAGVDYETRTVSFDSTFTKASSSPVDIAIWRFGDGQVIKSDTSGDISDNEVIEHTFNEPGTYTIGYSVIDKNDLSDEASCTVTFASEEDEEGSTEDYTSPTCGKSATEYNSTVSVVQMNSDRSGIRQSIILGVIGLLVLLYTTLFVRKGIFGWKKS